MVRRLLLAAAAVTASAGCNDFNGLYETCVSEGKCVEEGRPSAATSELSIDRTQGLTADGVDAAELRVTIRDLQGKPVANRSVRFVVEGDGAVAGAAGPSDSSGVVRAALTSSRIGVKTVSAVIVLDEGEATLAVKVSARFEAGPPSATASTFALSATSVPASGTASARAIVKLLDASGNPVAAQLVSIAGTGLPTPLTLLGPPTDASGATSVEVSSVETGLAQLSARVLHRDGEIVLAARPTLTFTPAAPAVLSASTPTAIVGGCVPISYSLSQLQATPTDVTVEYSVNGGPRRLATLAGGAGDGIRSLGASRDGTAHTFLWNSTADLKRATEANVELFLTPRVGAATGASRRLGVSVANGVTFAPRSERLAGLTSNQVLVRDLDRDGAADVVVYARDSTGTLSYFRTLGTGALPAAPTQQLSYTAESEGLQLVDLDRNGSEDLLGLGTGGVLVAFNAAGTFASPTGLQGVPAGSDRVLAGDLNRDGLPEVITFVSSSGTYSVHGGIASSPGIGPAGASQATGLSQLKAVQLEDFNRDGILDLLIAGEADARLVTGMVTLAGGGTPVALGTGLRAVEAADFDGDGWLDLAYVGDAPSPSVGRHLFLARGTGPALFAGAVSQGSATFETLEAIDVNRDGLLDLVGVEAERLGVSVFTGTGAASSQAFTRAGFEPTDGRPSHAAAADLDRDGRMDLIAATLSGRLNVLRGTAPPRCDPGFAAPGAAVMDGGVTRLTAADINGDGKPDAIASIATSDVLNIALSSGTGGLGERLAIGAGDSPIGVVARDFDGDGRVDLAVVSAGSGELAILRGAGDGTFLITARLPLGAAPIDLVAGDFNRDGAVDLVASATGADSRGVWFFAGSPTGAFAAGVRSPSSTSGSSPVSLAAGDLDGDGDLDLVATAADGLSVRRLINGGGGGFEELAPLAATAQSLALADLDGDARPDLVTGETGQLGIHLAVAGGGFGRSTVGLADPASTVAAIVSADFDRDGDLDLAIGRPSAADNFSVLLNDGSGTLVEQPALTILGDVRALASEDLDGDLYPDLLAGSAPPQGSVVVLLNPRDGGFRVAPETPFAGQVVADLDRDGKLDLAGGAQVAFGRGDGTFTPPTTLAAPLLGVFAAAGDLDRDGDLDLVSTDGILIRRHLNDGAGGFSAQIDLSSGGVITRVGIFDLDQDGDQDLLAAGGTEARTLLAGGHGSFTGAWSAWPLGAQMTDVAFVDVTGDGRVDVLGVDGLGGKLAYVVGQSNASFSAGAQVVTNSWPIKLVAGDVNRDGRPDAVVLAQRTGSTDFTQMVIQVLERVSGSSPFLVRDQDEVIGDARALALEDFDQDGWLDVAVAEAQANDVLVFNGRGGSLTAERTLMPGRACGGITAADLDRDGKPDLVVKGAAHPGTWTFLAR